MKLRGLFLAFCFIDVAFCGDRKVQDDATSFIQKISSNWHSDIKKVEKKTETAFEGFLKEIESFRTTLITVTSTLGDKEVLDKTNKSISDGVNQLKKQFADKNIDEFFDQIDANVQKFLTDIVKQINAAESSAELTECWKKYRSTLTSIVEGFLKDLLKVVSTEANSLDASARKAREIILQADSALSNGVKKCQKNKDVKTCTSDIVSCSITRTLPVI